MYRCAARASYPRKVKMQYYQLTFIVLLLCQFCFKIVNLSGINQVDCLICAQKIPDCPSCDEDESCFIIKRTCYQCSRAVCGKKKYRRNRKSCKSKKKPKCHCSSDQTCLITVRNQISCPKAKCIDLIDPSVRYLEDYIP